MVLTTHLFPLPQYYREVCTSYRHYRGKIHSAVPVTAALPLSPLLCISLVRTSNFSFSLHPPLLPPVADISHCQYICTSHASETNNHLSTSRSMFLQQKDFHVIKFSLPVLFQDIKVTVFKNRTRNLPFIKAEFNKFPPMSVFLWAPAVSTVYKQIWHKLEKNANLS